MQRTVQFWRLANADGSSLSTIFPAGRVVRALQHAEQHKLRRYRKCTDGVETLGKGVAVRPLCTVALYRTRRTNLPRLNDDGAVTPIPLGHAQSLAEPSYFGFHPRNVVSLLYNNDGPRASRLPDYLNAKLGCNVRLLPIYREDLADVLDQMRMTAVELSIPAAQVAHLAGGDSWAEVLENQARLLSDGYIGMKISIGRGGKAADRESRAGRIKDLVGLLRGRNDLAAFKKIKVTGNEGGDGETIVVDLLEQRFISKVETDAEPANQPADVVDANASTLLHEKWASNRRFLESVSPQVRDTDASLVGGFVENPDDESDDADDT